MVDVDLCLEKAMKGLEKFFFFSSFFIAFFSYRCSGSFLVKLRSRLWVLFLFFVFSHVGTGDL